MSKVVIYARGDAHELARQQEHCRRLADTEGHEVVGLALDGPGQANGWYDATTMVRRGLAERILVASRSLVPDLIESATQHLLPGRRPKRINPPE